MRVCFLIRSQLLKISDLGGSKMKYTVRRINTPYFVQRFEVRSKDCNITHLCETEKKELCKDIEKRFKRIGRIRGDVVFRFDNVIINNRLRGRFVFGNEVCPKCNMTFYNNNNERRLCANCTNGSE